MSGMFQRVKKFIEANRPEPVKCDNCEQPIPLFPTAGAHSLAFCPKTGQGHSYTLTIGGDPEAAEINRLMKFAASEAALARREAIEECANVVCALCRNGDAAQRSESGGYYHRTKYHTYYCVASAIHEKG